MATSWIPGIYVTEGSDFVEDFLDSIKLLQIIPTGLVKESKGWILDWNNLLASYSQSSIKRELCEKWKGADI